ncbi:MAG: hypothetical protein PHD67_01390 [Oscillospiraceae bacterium]|nr:hypothetical protein [Oscillospiraceae bacterium]
MSVKQDKETLEWGEIYAKEPKVKVKLAADPLNPEDGVVPVCLNGYNYFVKRGTTVELPKTVAEILAGAGYLA